MRTFWVMLLGLSSVSGITNAAAVEADLEITAKQCLITLYARGCGTDHTWYSVVEYGDANRVAVDGMCYPTRAEAKGALDELRSSGICL